MTRFGAMPAYELPPIDYWAGTIEFDPEYEAKIAAEPEPAGIFGEAHARSTELTELHRRAVVVFRELHWEGDGGWVYGAVPGDTTTQLWISVKQENNGTTYVLSPVAMPWLDRLAFTVAP
jgi:hypothetical protein